MADTTPEGFLTAIKGLSIESTNTTVESIEIFNDLLKIVPEDRQFELAELLVDFTQKHDSLLQFIANIVSIEVNQTKQEMVLFREDCFAVKCINRVLFGDLGKKYLTRLVTPLVRSILTVKDTVEIQPALAKSNPTLFKQNLELTVSFLDQFLTLFNKSPQFCPILFREIFSIIQQNVDTKFGNNTSPYVLDFIFFKFICPAIISPGKYELIDEDEVPSIPAMRSLINISKILNNLAHNIVDKFEEQSEFDSLLNFIGKNHSILIASLNRLVDPVDIARTKGILTASISETPPTSEELSDAEETLRSFLDSVIRYRSPRNTLQNVSPSADMKEIKYAELSKKINSLKWKQKYNAGKSVGYTAKEEESSLICMKVESTFNAPLKVVFDFFSNIDNLPEIYAGYLAEPITIISASEADHWKSYAVVFKFPFPFSNRQNAFSQWDYMFPDESKAYIVIDQYNGPNFIPKKGCIRGQLHVSGWMLEQEAPNVTKFTNIQHGHPKGSIPTWLVNSMNGSGVSITEVFRKKLEANCK